MTAAGDDSSGTGDPAVAGGPATDAGRIDPVSQDPAGTEPPGWRRGWRLGLVGLVGLVLVGLVAGGLVVLLGESGPTAEDEVTDVSHRYLAAWSAERWDELERLTIAAGLDVAAVHRSVDAALAAERWSLRPGSPVVLDDEAVVAVEVTVHLAGFGEWRYDTDLTLVRNPVEEEEAPPWVVLWEPTTIHRAMADGRSLRLVRTWPERAPILAADGTPLSGAGAPALPALRAHVLGVVAPAGEERAAELGAPWAPGEPAGTGGLQAAFDRRLAGRPTGEVSVVDGQAVVEVLETFPGAAGEAVPTTFDPAVQAAGEAVLGSRGQPAALVAIDVGTGEVRAVVNRPVGGFNRALVGRYPPGSTFKVVTTTALLTNGVNPQTPTTCPATTSIAGRRFSNAGGEELGDIPFATAFFRSCNTAFVQLAEQLPSGALAAAAGHYGFDATVDLPIPAVTGSFPPPEGPVEAAAAAIGQGRVTASPLQMAVVAATVAAGAHRPPRVIAGEPPSDRPLPDGVAATLQELMRLVVAQGTATAAQLPGPPVAGKTGTAEFGTASPPRTHAWFIGFRGSLAVAVVVEDAGFGGEVAAPLAADFLARTTG